MDVKQIDRVTQKFRAGTVPSLCPASSVGQRPGGDIPVASLWWLTGLHQLQCSYNTDNGCNMSHGTQCAVSTWFLGISTSASAQDIIWHLLPKQYFGLQASYQFVTVLRCKYKQRELRIWHKFLNVQTWTQSNPVKKIRYLIEIENNAFCVA